MEASLATAGVRTDFADFYRAELPQVYRGVYLLTGDRQAALDLTQEAFARAYARWRRLSREEWAGGWVMTTALNLAKHRVRETASPRLPEGAPAAAPAPERVDLVRALRTLPFRQRQALVLHYVGDLHPRAIAQAMNVSEGTVKAHLAQGRAALRRKLEVFDG
ncbi:MAG TPA: sigma-70 family RNA polymerase sigma factor [Actinomycetota bacterium]|nr:sigma-70 family RNA polymerase sigma factor [Actinomycetota bacterium]